MVLQKQWVSQNFRQNSQVLQSCFVTVMCILQSRFLSQTCLAESIFSRLRKPRSTDLFRTYIWTSITLQRLKLAFKTLSSLSLASEEVKMSQARKEKCWSHLLAKSRTYHSPPLTLQSLLPSTGWDVFFSSVIFAGPIVNFQSIL